jgi:hypothetical protein
MSIKLINTTFSFVPSKRPTTDKYIKHETDDKLTESVCCTGCNKTRLLALHLLFQCVMVMKTHEMVKY